MIALRASRSGSESFLSPGGPGEGAKRAAYLWAGGAKSCDMVNVEGRGYLVTATGSNQLGTRCARL
eukprot:6303682-Pyramimonas_sp.AAC.1